MGVSKKNYTIKGLDKYNSRYLKSEKIDLLNLKN